jgi:hypothetical protein
MVFTFLTGSNVKMEIASVLNVIREAEEVTIFTDV